MFQRRLCLTAAFLAFVIPAAGLSQDSAKSAATPIAEEQAVRQVSIQFARAFNSAKADQVADLFLENGELIDDAGNAHKGRALIGQLLARFFEKFPGAASTMQTESVWFVDRALAIAEGQRVVTTKEGSSSSATHYMLVLKKQGEQWKIASAKESEDETILSPHERLKPLAWMTGDWVDEGADGLVKISCRWSEDKNFLLVDFQGTARGRAGLKSSQRIGWDPLTKKIRSWVFDSDGGHGQADWTQAGNRWVVKSSAVLPDGQTGSATLSLEPQDKDHFTMKGVDRIQGDTPQPDFSIVIVRKPPEPAR